MATEVLRLGIDSTGMVTGARMSVSATDAVSSGAQKAAGGVDKLDSSMRRGASGAKTLYREIMAAAGAIGAFGLARSIVQAGAELDGLERGLNAVSNSSAAALQQLRALQEVAKLPGLGFKEAIQGAVRLQAVGFSAKETTRILEAFGNAVATTGGGKAELDRITVQLTQLSAKGVVLANDLRPIIDAGPLVARALQQAFGTVDPERIQELTANSRDFLEKLLAELEKFPKVTGGAKNAIENLADASFRLRGELGESFLEELSPTVDLLTDSATKFTENRDAIEGLAKSTAALVDLLAMMLSPLAKVVEGWGMLFKLIDSFKVPSWVKYVPLFGALPSAQDVAPQPDQSDQQDIFRELFRKQEAQLAVANKARRDKAEADQRAEAAAEKAAKAAQKAFEAEAKYTAKLQERNRALASGLLTEKEISAAKADIDRFAKVAFSQDSSIHDRVIAFERWADAVKAMRDYMEEFDTLTRTQKSIENVAIGSTSATAADRAIAKSQGRTAAFSDDFWAGTAMGFDMGPLQRLAETSNNASEQIKRLGDEAHGTKDAFAGGSSEGKGFWRSIRDRLFGSKDEDGNRTGGILDPKMLASNAIAGLASQGISALFSIATRGLGELGRSILGVESAADKAARQFSEGLTNALERARAANKQFIDDRTKTQGDLDTLQEIRRRGFSARERVAGTPFDVLDIRSATDYADAIKKIEDAMAGSKRLAADKDLQLILALLKEAQDEYEKTLERRRQSIRDDIAVLQLQADGQDEAAAAMQRRLQYEREYADEQDAETKALIKQRYELNELVIARRKEAEAAEKLKRDLESLSGLLGEILGVEVSNAERKYGRGSAEHLAAMQQQGEFGIAERVAKAQEMLSKMDPSLIEKIFGAGATVDSVLQRLVKGLQDDLAGAIEDAGKAAAEAARAFAEAKQSFLDTLTLDEFGSQGKGQEAEELQADIRRRQRTKEAEKLFSGDELAAVIKRIGEQYDREIQAIIAKYAGGGASSESLPASSGVREMVASITGISEVTGIKIADLTRTGIDLTRTAVNHLANIDANTRNLAGGTASTSTPAGRGLIVSVNFYGPVSVDDPDAFGRQVGRSALGEINTGLAYEQEHDDAVAGNAVIN